MELISRYMIRQEYILNSISYSDYVFDNFIVHGEIQKMQRHMDSLGLCGNLLTVKHVEDFNSMRPMGQTLGRAFNVRDVINRGRLHCPDKSWTRVNVEFCDIKKEMRLLFFSGKQAIRTCIAVRKYDPIVDGDLYAEP